jgi:protein gp37
MSTGTTIEWTEATWNPLVGCSRVSAGCQRCYAERLVHRGLAPQHRGLTKLVGGEPRWTGEVRLVESALSLPLRWKTPRRVFVNSLSDLFHESVPDEWVLSIFEVMGGAWWHTYQLLTKRPERMAAVIERINPTLREQGRAPFGPVWKHVWLGVSVEDQATADERIPLLLETPAEVRWVSAEPLLGPVDFSPWFPPRQPALDWVVVGGES